jgi:hypothetical protein
VRGTVTCTAASAGTEAMRHRRAADVWLSTARSLQARTAASHRASSRSGVRKRVDAGVQAAQRAAPHPAPHRVEGEAEPEQLRPGDHAVLPLGELHEPSARKGVQVTP